MLRIVLKTRSSRLSTTSTALQPPSTTAQVGPANAFVNLAPRTITFKAGGVITAALGAAIFPWRLLSSSSSFVGWLVAYSSLLGPVIGVIISDFWVVKGRRLDVDALYSSRADGPYYYAGGYNPAAVVSGFGFPPRRGAPALWSDQHFGAGGEMSDVQWE